MRPKRKRAGHEQPDLAKEEVAETVGGTDGEPANDENWGKIEPAENGGYARPQEQDVDDEHI